MTSQATPVRASSRQLIGRLEELARLEAQVREAVADGRPRLVVLEGPAGVGKSRLVGELAARLRKDDGAVLFGHCVPDGHRVLPYAPVVEIATDLVRREGAATVRRWAGATAPELARLVPLLGGGEARAGTSASSTRLFQALCAVLDRAAAKRPHLLVVEDLHWADRSTRELLGLLAQQLRGKVCFVITLRTDEVPHDPGVTRWVSEVGRRTEQRLSLAPLSREEQAHQLSDILGVPPTRELLDEVYRRAEGNPFFAEELLALGRPGELPPTLRDLLLVRVEALPPATRQVLRAAAVAGRHVPHVLLDAIGDVTGPRLEGALRPAVDGHVLLASRRGDGYSFRHALLNEAVAASLLPGEASRLHRRLAETLTASPELAGASPFVRGRIAQHWFAAGEKRQALVSSVEAAQEAKDGLAFSESLAHYERAVGLLDLVPDGETLLDMPRYWLLWSAAEVAHLAGLPERATALVRQALDVVDRRNPHHHGYLYERLGRYLWMGADGVSALAAYERAVQMVPADPPTRWRAAALSGYSQILMLTSRFAEAQHWAEETLSVARRVPDGQALEGHARCNLGVALARQGRLEDGVAELVEARRVAEDTFEDVDDIARAIVNLESVYTDAGRLHDAARVAMEAVAVVDGLGLQRRKGVWCRCEAARALARLGRHDEASELLREARDLNPQGVDAVLTDLAQGELSLRLGRLDEADHHLVLARDSARSLLDGQILGPLYAALVEVATWRQEYDVARDRAQEGRDRLRADEDPAYAVPLFAAAVHAEVERALGSRSRGTGTSVEASIETWLARSDHALATSSAEAPVAAALDAEAHGAAARVRGEHDPERWAAVVSAWETIGDRHRETHARMRLAEAFLSLDGQRSAARKELVTAHAAATALGARSLVDGCERLARRARVTLTQPVQPPEDRGFGLTARERDVLDLVAEGLTDRQIGERLFISHRTVERHVSNLLAKLDASRRSQLVTAAQRFGLLGT